MTKFWSDINPDLYYQDTGESEETTMWQDNHGSPSWLTPSQKWRLESLLVGKPQYLQLRLLNKLPHVDIELVNTITDESLKLRVQQTHLTPYVLDQFLTLLERLTEERGLPLLTTLSKCFDDYHLDE